MMKKYDLSQKSNKSMDILHFINDYFPIFALNYNRYKHEYFNFYRRHDCAPVLIAYESNL